MEDQEQELFLSSVANKTFTPAESEEKKFDVHAVDSLGNTPLHSAANWGIIWGTIQEVEALIDEGADINAINILVKTPLHEAINMDELQVAVLLLSRHARTDIRSKAGRTAEDMADSQPKRDLFSNFRKKKND